MIKRDKYLTQLISAKNNGFPKVITGVRRCGKSFLLKEIYREYLLSDNVPENRIIILELDDDKNSNYRDPRKRRGSAFSFYICTSFLWNERIQLHYSQNSTIYKGKMQR